MFPQHHQDVKVETKASMETFFAISCQKIIIWNWSMAAIHPHHQIYKTLTQSGDSTT